MYCVAELRDVKFCHGSTLYYAKNRSSHPSFYFELSVVVFNPVNKPLSLTRPFRLTVLGTSLAKGIFSLFFRFPARKAKLLIVYLARRTQLNITTTEVTRATLTAERGGGTRDAVGRRV